ncbi:MAG: isopentenyl-diphosphate Delta-isomerase [Anaerolineae bacterium]|nr:isopentenyl-diphosphate Delta-isomerase [Anaerolineae bacterium]
MEEQVILVTHQDKEIGTMEKVKAHREGKLHRAFSVLIFSAQGELLLQKRADTKYHCGGMWTNACDGHPRPGEAIVDAAQRRLREELGFSCPLEKMLQFTYRAELDHGLEEHEVDHLLIGRFDGIPNPDPAEVSEVKWIGWDALEQNVCDNPEQYAAWSKIAFTYRTAIEAALAASNEE